MILRRCLKEPVSGIFKAWDDMSAAVEAHIGGDGERAAQLFKKANGLRIWHWLNPAWSIDVDNRNHIDVSGKSRGITTFRKAICKLDFSNASPSLALPG